MIERISISEGNAKMGRIPSFSTIPTGGIIRRKDGMALTTERGTCAGCCDGCAGECYAVRTCKVYPSARRAYERNTRIMRRDVRAMHEQLRAYIDRERPDVFRIHVSGEFDSGKRGANELMVWAQLAREFPGTTFYGYTKRASLLKRYAHRLPSNLRLLLSVWHDDVPRVPGVPCFVYDDGTDDEAASLPHCPAVAADGKRTGVTCRQCRRCWTLEPGESVAVHAH